jgi:FkbM family methyltransferase
MKYGEAIPKGFHIPKSAFWLRADLEKRNPFELLPLRKGDTVMDCGAYIGTFTAAALEQGAKWAVCYEAAPKNAELLRGNMERYGDRVSICEYALVAGNGLEIELTMSGFSGANSVIPSPNRKKHITVPAVNFRGELARIKPTVLKIDIEGGEYPILDTLKSGDLRRLNAIFIEFHPDPNREEKVMDFWRFLAHEKFEVISKRNRAFIAVRK